MMANLGLWFFWLGWLSIFCATASPPSTLLVYNLSYTDSLSRADAYEHTALVAALSGLALSPLALCPLALCPLACKRLL